MTQPRGPRKCLPIFVIVRKFKHCINQKHSPNSILTASPRPERASRVGSFHRDGVLDPALVICGPEGPGLAVGETPALGDTGFNVGHDGRTDVAAATVYTLFPAVCIKKYINYSTRTQITAKCFSSKLDFFLLLMICYSSF